MSLINDLTHFFKANLPDSLFRGQKFTAFTDNMELTRQFSQVTAKQLQVGRLTYDAVFSFDEIAYRVVNPQLLFALVNVWIEQLDDSVQFKVEDNPEVDVDIIDEELADISISIKVTENLYMIENELGEIPFNNKRYSLQDLIIWSSPESVQVIMKKAK